VPNDSCCVISFLCLSGFGMLLVGKTQKKHLGDLPPTVPDLPGAIFTPATLGEKLRFWGYNLPRD